MIRPVLALFAAMVMWSATSTVSAKDELPWAFNGKRAEGYTIDLVKVDPAPGTPLVAGSSVDFKITVSYSMSIAKKGSIILVFQDEKDRSAKPDGPVVAVPVTEGSGTIDLSDKLTIPKNAKELRLFIPLSPEGLTETSGEVTIRYPIKKK